MCVVILKMAFRKKYHWFQVQSFPLQWTMKWIRTIMNSAAGVRLKGKVCRVPWYWFLQETIATLLHIWNHFNCRKQEPCQVPWCHFLSLSLQQRKSCARLYCLYTIIVFITMLIWPLILFYLALICFGFSIFLLQWIDISIFVFSYVFIIYIFLTKSILNGFS